VEVRLVRLARTGESKSDTSDRSFPALASLARDAKELVATGGHDSLQLALDGAGRCSHLGGDLRPLVTLSVQARDLVLTMR
jgi:hypothetical protein